MKAKNAIQILIVLAISFFLISCEDEETGNIIKTTTLTHGGFDFSTGIAGSFEGEGTAVEGADFDGEVIGWRPGGGGGTGQSIYWRNDQGGLNNEQKDMGTLSLATLTTVPDSLNDIQPLVVDHVYVVKCKDGYAAFKVTAIDTDEWEADVQYIFSTNENFVSLTKKN